jgi:hypothetical protein
MSRCEDCHVENTVPFVEANLRSLTAKAAGKLNVLALNCDSLGVDRAKICVLEL